MSSGMYQVAPGDRGDWRVQHKGQLICTFGDKRVAKRVADAFEQLESNRDPAMRDCSITTRRRSMLARIRRLVSAY